MGIQNPFQGRMLTHHWQQACLVLRDWLTSLSICLHPLFPAVHGGWTRWSEWTECSTTCNDGTQTRTRSCTNPEPMYGGDDCEGEWVENRNCFLKHCPVDCVWLDWTEWGQCNRDCGNGTQHRTREKVVEQFEGRPCEGPGAESRPCNTHHCPGE